MIISDNSVDGLLVHTMLLVSLFGAHYLESIESLILVVEGKPHSREVSPTHFLKNDISIVQNLTIGKIK